MMDDKLSIGGPLLPNDDPYAYSADPSNSSRITTSKHARSHLKKYTARLETNAREDRQRFNEMQRRLLEELPESRGVNKSTVEDDLVLQCRKRRRERLPLKLQRRS